MKRSKNAYQYKVPYDPNGNLMHYPSVEFDWSGVRYEDDCASHGILNCSNNTWHYRNQIGSPVRREPEWRDNDVFEAVMALEGSLGRGRSAKYVFWANGDKHFPMFVADLVELVRNAEVSLGGIVTGSWRVRKRGENYGLIYWPKEG